ncbi:DUF2076 domain-containing protein [Zavarzinia compransoris]|uniref:DUF2076 domain-containing protein n=1 Tax=Zavarzinia compransoris TaxID=1264899 RepID=A0A317DTS6_9PROT|nr:DUF2076 domain-containing protein [Zavarzinia compransoris]PWR18079.1 DUF2076 domain-containing protein [Zavarzinia compransoris]TDP43445.1 hypothetical protein DES42_11111 [Zavarzinia compransoris]
MDRNDRQAIEALFGKLATVERQSPPRDAEAEAFIHERIAAQSAAPYYLAQTVVVQEHALQAAEARIADLEAQVAEARRPAGGLFGGLFGGGRAPARAGTAPRGGAPARGPFPGAQPQASGGFLAGAAQTAMGVAGGVLLGNAIAGLFSSDEAQAAEPAPEDSGFDDAGFDDGGGFGGDEF